MPPISITELFGNYLIVVDATLFWAYAVASALLLAVAVPWLANRPQPVPSVGAWQLAEQDRKAAQ